jgi:hypothetical protein
MIRVILDYQLTNSNAGQSRHWSNHHRQNKIAIAAVQAVESQKVAFGRPVAIRVVRVIGKRGRFYDPDSILRGVAAKCLIDAFVSCGWLVDDSAKFVLQVVGDQIKSTDGVHRTIVEFHDKPAYFAE